MKIMNNWIDEDVIIDFPISGPIKDNIEKMEELNKKEDWGYFEFYDATDNLFKVACAKGIFKYSDWKTYQDRYGKEL